jgi:hypothetical protein
MFFYFIFTSYDSSLYVEKSAWDPSAYVYTPAVFGAKSYVSPGQPVPIASGNPVFGLTLRVIVERPKDHDENIDYGPYDKDDSEEEEAGQNITSKAATKTTVKTKNSVQKTAQKAAEMDRIEEFRAKAFSGSISSEELKECAELTKPKEPTARAKYDHETTMKNLIDDTKEVVARMEKLKDDYETVHYMGLLCDYWKTLHKMTDLANRPKKNAHDAFIKHFKKYQHEYGLPPAIPSTEGSKTSSRTASVAPVDKSEEGEEMEEIEEEEEEVEETK